MSERNIARSFLALWWTLGILLIAYSVQTAWLSVAASGGVDAHVVILAAAEAMAGLLFLLPQAMRVGGVSLIGIFALAFVLHGSHGEFEGELLIYAVAVSLVLDHDPISLRASMGQEKQ